VLTDPKLIEQYTRLRGQPWAVASSTMGQHPAAQARSAFDGNASTVWIASPDDPDPKLYLRWQRPAKISTLTLRRPPAAGGSVQVLIEGIGGQTREALSDAGGRLTFAPMTTDRIRLTFRRAGRLQATQVSEVVLPGVRPSADLSDFPFQLECGYGPRFVAGSATVNTSVTGTMGDLLEGRPIAFEACGGVPLAAGTNRLSNMPFDPFRIETALLGEQPKAAASVADELRPARVLEWGAGERRLRVDAPRRSFLAVNENYNVGWEARAGGTKLRPLRLDGWKQGWVVPAGTSGTVELTYRPDVAQRTSVVAGLGMLLVLLLFAVRPRRRVHAQVLQRGPAPGAGGWPGWAVFVLAAALGGWVAGAPGLVAASGAVMIHGWARRRATWVRTPLASPWTPALLLVAGTGCLATGYQLGLLENPLVPSGYLGDIVPQLLGVVILGRVAAALWRPHRSGGGDQAASIELSWARPQVPRPGPPDPPVLPDPAERDGGDGDGPAAEPEAPPGSSSRSRLRWSPRGAGEGRSPRSPGTPGPPTRTSRR
jgi:arabinofuranan 3-O-arabinosyltransferase